MGAGSMSKAVKRADLSSLHPGGFSGKTQEIAGRLAGAIVTDVGITKRSVVEPHRRYYLGTPACGQPPEGRSEKRGVESRGPTCSRAEILTPTLDRCDACRR